jgi:ABC-2 type transport system permease protein
VALVIPPGTGETLGSFAGAGPKLVLLADVSDPVASQIVQGLLQKVALTAAPELVVKHGIEQFARYAGALTEQQRAAVDAFMPALRSQAAGAETGLPAPVEIVDVMKARRGNDLVSFYAAGVAVMFLLFSASAGAGTLLDEVDSGTLERVLTSRLGMTGLLCGKWLYLAGLGALQIGVMFTWGALAFGLPLLGHLPGFVAMTAATAAAAAGFGLMLATIARSRAQLSGLSTIVILVMSSLGGSMFPRFLMSPAMQTAGLFTFNAWALDGYIKVFWRDAPLLDLWPQLAMLVTLTLAFLGTARLLARRWEAV